jgi:hypothetical protein
MKRTMNGVFLGLVLSLSACTSPSRAPSSSDTKLDRMLRSCGPVPVREVAHRLTLSPRERLVWGTGEVFYTNRECAKAPCGKIVETKYAVSPVAMGYGTAMRSFASGLLNVFPEKGWKGGVIEAGATIKIAGAVFFRLFPDDQPILASIRRGEFYLNVGNQDFSLSDTVANLSPYFEVSIDSDECPLPREEQGDRCAERRLPYDRTEAILQKNYQLYRDSRAYKKRNFAKKIELKQDSRGYAYLVEYEDAEGRVIPGSDQTRFTANRYVILDAFTHLPCPGWKIRRVALNAHNGKFPYGHYVEVKKDPATGKTGFKQKSTAQLHPVDFQYFTPKFGELYKPGAEILLNLCYSIDHRLGTQANIGNVFRDVPAEKNPIGKVVGVPGTCVTYNQKADANNFHVWPVYLFQPDGRVSGRVEWKNPTFHPDSKDAGKTYPIATDEDAATLARPKTMHAEEVIEREIVVPVNGGH